MQVAELLKQFAPGGRPATLKALAVNWAKLGAAGISTPLRVAHFLAQIATETGGFTIIEENMNYSAQRLCQVWPSHFRSLGQAAAYAHAPEKLANYIYADANRQPSHRLGNVKEGDGWRYRGRGFMQTTGRENYRKAGHEDDPDALADVAVSLDAAIDEWVRGRCNALADDDNLRAIRRVINGGVIGLDHAEVHLARAKRLFTAEALRSLGVPYVPPPEEPPKPAPTPPKVSPPSRPDLAGGAASTAAGGIVTTGANAMGIDPFVALAVGFIVAVGIFVAVRKYRRSR